MARNLAREDWQELSAGAGSKGPRLFAWARIELTVPEISEWQRWLLVRRSLDEGEKPAEMAYVLVFAPADTSLEEMVETFGTRWTVEQCFEKGKGEVGLDEIRQTYHFRECGWKEYLWLARELLPLALESDRPLPLIKHALELLRTQRILPPGFLHLERFTWIILKAAERRLYRFLTSKRRT